MTTVATRTKARPNRPSRCLWGALVLTIMAILTVPQRSLAQGAAEEGAGKTSAESEAAERFERGIALYRDGALPAALVEFERAYELTSDYRVLYNMAHVQAERHHYAEAVETYERYLKEGGSQLSEERRTSVQTDLEILRTHLAKLWVESNVEGAELFIDDRSVGTLPLSGPVVIDAGMARVRLEKPGYVDATQTIKVAGGESPRLTLPMSRAATSDALQPAEPEASVDNRSSSGPKRNYTPFWVSAGVTAALGGTAAAFGILVGSTNGKLDDEFENNPADQDRINTLSSRGTTYSWLADGFAIGTAVAAGVSIYFLVAAPRSKSSIQVGGTTLRVKASPFGAHLQGTF